jgi:hypothetical protein
VKGKLHARAQASSRPASFAISFYELNTLLLSLYKLFAKPRPPKRHNPPEYRAAKPYPPNFAAIYNDFTATFTGLLDFHFN